MHQTSTSFGSSMEACNFLFLLFNSLKLFVSIGGCVGDSAFNAQNMMQRLDLRPNTIIGLELHDLPGEITSKFGWFV